MNKESIIGFTLIIGILVGWTIWMTPSKEEIERQKYIQDSLHFIEEQKSLEHRFDEQQDEASVAIRDKFGYFASSAVGEEKAYTVENDVLKITLSSKGGYVKTVMLKDYKTWDSLPLIGFDENTSRFNLAFFAANRNINTMDLYFVPFVNGVEYKGDKALAVDDNPLTFSFRAYADDMSDNINPNEYIEFSYTLTKDEYMVDFDVKTVNMKDVIASNSNFLTIDWYVDILKQEKAVDRYNGSNVYYKFVND